MKLMNFVLVILCGGVHISHCEILKCKFGDVGYSIGSFYSCEVTSLDVTNDSMVINGSSGTHLPNKTDAFVKGIYIHDTNTKYIPRNLGNIFNLNISALRMSTTQLVEIKSQNFIGMENLEELGLGGNKLTSIPLDVFSKLLKLKLINLSQNQITEIPNGVFANNLQLEKIHLWDNKIKFLGSTLFDELPKLYFVDLEKNICIDKEYSGSTAIIQLKNNYKILCKNPNQAPLITSEISTEAPTATTPNPLELENGLIKELNINLEKENIELRKNSLEEKANHEKDRLDWEEKNRNLNDRLTTCEVNSNDVKLIEIMKKINDLEQFGKTKFTNLERIGNETLMKSEEIHQRLEQESKHKELMNNFTLLNQKDREASTELLSICEFKNQELLKLNSFTMNCDFTDTDGAYTCVSNQLPINNRNMKINTVIGTHFNHNSNGDVIKLIITNTTTLFWTNDIFLQFPVLQILRIHNAKLQEFSNGDFSSATNLKSLDIKGNDMKSFKFNFLPAN